MFCIFTEPEDDGSDDMAMCTCAVMEQNFLQMAECAYKRIRRLDNSPADFDRFRTELAQTNDILRESMGLMKHIRDICDHRKRPRWWKRNDLPARLWCPEFNQPPVTQQQTVVLFWLKQHNSSFQLFIFIALCQKSSVTYLTGNGGSRRVRKTFNDDHSIWYTFH